MQHRFIKTWYATENRMQSKMKWLVYDDYGTLTLTSEGLDFNGRKTFMSIRRVKRISLATQPVPWTSYIIGNIVAFLIVGGFSIIAFSKVSMPPIIILLILLVAFGGGSLVGLIQLKFVQQKTRWVKVEYLDERNNLCCAYFADGGVIGWSGILGGTVNMCSTLKTNLLRPD